MDVLPHLISDKFCYIWVVNLCPSRPIFNRWLWFVVRYRPWGGRSNCLAVHCRPPIINYHGPLSESIHEDRFSRPWCEWSITWTVRFCLWNFRYNFEYKNDKEDIMSHDGICMWFWDGSEFESFSFSSIPARVLIVRPSEAKSFH